MTVNQSIPLGRMRCSCGRVAWVRFLPVLVISLLITAIVSWPSNAQSPIPPRPIANAQLRGFFFNPRVNGEVQIEAWLMEYHRNRDTIDRELRELVAKTGINFIDIHVLIPRTLAKTKTPPTNQATAIDQWANMTFMENLVSFLNMCGEAGVTVEVDLATNMWIPFSVDTKNHIANSRWWPEPDETPWTESAVWYTQIIEYVENHVRDKDVIALWCMFGNYQLGGAEPILWTSTTEPLINRYTERFVKHTWPKFLQAGQRPKGAPIVLPIFSNVPHWMARDSRDRLSAMVNLKKWIVDDLQLPPDYWIVTTYPYSDPASDGIEYLHRLVDIVGQENASRIISTDFKGPGIDFSETIIKPPTPDEPQRIRWNLAKARELGFAGWWMWAYRDTATRQFGIRDIHGNWKEDLVTEITR